VLQAGTAVLVDDRGVPRARCACGNPLTPPEAVQSAALYTGQEWPGFRPDAVTAVAPSPQPLDKLVLTDVNTGQPFERPVGTAGTADTAVPPTTTVSTTTTTTTAPVTTTSAASTTSAAATTTAPPQTSTTSLATTTLPPPRNVTREGTPSVSSQYDATFGPDKATDDDPTTSWFSAGNKDPEGDQSTFTWQGRQTDFITSIEIIGNENNSTAQFQQGENFKAMEIQVLDDAGTVVFQDQFTFDTSTPLRKDVDVATFPSVRGRTIKVIGKGHRDPNCGGFAEIKVMVAG
jgi:hypothetical protein